MKTSQEMKKTYLGDSVYATDDGFHVVLTTENGAFGDPSNRIALDPEVLGSLFRFCEERKPKLEEVALPEALGESIKRTITSTMAGAQYSKDTCIKGARALTRIAGELSPDVDLNAYGGSFWLTVKNRADVQVLMKLAPRWSKSVYDGGIDYTAEVDGVEFRIRTTDGALPPTCRLVEKDVEIPEEPAKPARIEKRMVVECNQSA